MLSAEQIIESYQLEPLDQEGGFFRQVWQSPVRVSNTQLGSGYSEEGDHPLATVIHFLLTEDSFSAMHRLPTVEHWFYHLGDSCEMLLLDGEGREKRPRIGGDATKGDRIHYATPAGSWQGTRVVPGGSCGYMLGSCVMVPGFEWTDFELGDRASLTAQYPNAKEAIRLRTREQAVKGAL